MAARRFAARPLRAAEREPREPAEILAGRASFAASAVNSQRIVAIRGDNPRFSRFRTSKFAANLQQKFAANLQQTVNALPECSRGIATIPALCMWTQITDHTSYSTSSVYCQYNKILIGDTLSATGDQFPLGVESGPSLIRKPMTRLRRKRPSVAHMQNEHDLCLAAQERRPRSMASQPNAGAMWSAPDCGSSDWHCSASRPKYVIT